MKSSKLLCEPYPWRKHLCSCFAPLLPQSYPALTFCGFSQDWGTLAGRFSPCPMEVMEPDSSLTLSISNCGHGFLYATLVHAGTSHNSGSRAPFHLFPCTLGIPCPLGLHPFFPSGSDGNGSIKFAYF
eukprot:GGOE01035768.1.p1 GENE.GGOE01035768.1~~GGOE01035768.1.p1  ORF type:complete len:128 (-),score=0.10 GGOE01035768.1:458-841(-)